MQNLQAEVAVSENHTSKWLLDPEYTECVHKSQLSQKIWTMFYLDM